ncbi:MAG: hypothetical protein LC808_10320, partial [Actinobacteria bacterium]|nr:hypothetical protein [Actinomycetota bacterium]
MSYSVHATRSRMFHDELSDVLDIVLTGEVIDDRVTAERVVRSLGVVVDLHQRHTIDTRGRCPVCWTVPPRWWRPRPRRATCTVYAALNFWLRQPVKSVLAAI